MEVALVRIPLGTELYRYRIIPRLGKNLVAKCRRGAVHDLCARLPYWICVILSIADSGLSSLYPSRVGVSN